MKKADIWGQCPFAVYNIKLRAYRCIKTGWYCDPNYCLGPDGDHDKEEEHGRGERGEVQS